MSNWPSTKSKKIFSALLRIGWSVKRQRGSHIILEQKGYPDFVWAFHGDVEIGPCMLAKIAKKTGLNPEDL